MIYAKVNLQLHMQRVCYARMDLDIVRVSIPRVHLKEILNDQMVEYKGKNISSLKWLRSKNQTTMEKRMLPTSAKRLRNLEP